MSAAFATALKTLRQQAGVSQCQLAKASGLNHSMLSRLEANKRHPSRETVMRLANALDLSPLETEDLLSDAQFSVPGTLTRREIAQLHKVLTHTSDLLQRKDPDEAARYIEWAVDFLPVYDA